MMAVDTKTGEEVALKILNKEIEEMAMDIVEAEISSLSKLKNHPNIIGLLEFG